MHCCITRRIILLMHIWMHRMHHLVHHLLIPAPTLMHIDTAASRHHSACNNGRFSAAWFSILHASGISQVPWMALLQLAWQAPRQWLEVHQVGHLMTLDSCVVARAVPICGCLTAILQPLHQTDRHRSGAAVVVLLSAACGGCCQARSDCSEC